MKEKIKEFSKKYLIGFILGMLSAGVVSVAAAAVFPSNQTTYDNSSSGMSSTNVQDALDELYNVCKTTAGEQIIEDNNLEKDPYECRYFFTGANPNNYITFNNETASWRIISIGCDNTIKIMRDESIGNMAWDTSGSYGNNNWNRPATLNTYLNGTYYNNLTSTAKSQIVFADYSIGKVANENNDLADQINDENSIKWNGKVALPTASEYLRTNSDNANCKTLYANKENERSCRNTTWMYTSDYDNWWTLTPSTSPSGETYGVFSAYSYGRVYASAANSPNYAVRPVVTLSSDIKITGGDGSQSNPYTIE